MGVNVFFFFGIVHSLPSLHRDVGSKGFRVIPNPQQFRVIPNPQQFLSQESSNPQNPPNLKQNPKPWRPKPLAAHRLPRCYLEASGPSPNPPLPPSSLPSPPKTNPRVKNPVTSSHSSLSLQKKKNKNNTHQRMRTTHTKEE